MPYKIGIDARKVQDFGIGTYIRCLIDGLATIDSENQYVLLTGAAGQQLFLGLPDNFTTALERSPVYSFREQVALSWKLSRLDLDLYHATHYVLPAVVPVPTVVTIHDIIHLLYPEFLPNRLAFLYAQQMIRRSLSRGDRIITGSQNTKTDLIDTFDVTGSKIQVIYNGVDESFRKPIEEEERQRWLKQLDIPTPYLLFVGNPKPHKNLDRIVRAFAQAVETAPSDIYLVCVGDRDAASFKIRQRAEQLGIVDRVRLLGHVAQEALPAIYQSAEMFLYPTLYEGFGLPVIEAMASGVAVITSSSSALKEISEGYAVLVDPLDTDAITEAIIDLLRDEEHRQALASVGKTRAGDFVWRKAAEQTLETYYAAIRAHEKESKRWRRRKRSSTS